MDNSTMGKRKEIDAPLPPGWEEIVQEALLELKRERGTIERMLQANPVGLSNSRISELMHGKRQVTLYYLLKLNKGGFVKKEQFLQGRKPEKLPELEKQVYDQLEDTPRLRELIRKARDRGIDLEAWLSQLLGES